MNKHTVLNMRGDVRRIMYDEQLRVVSDETIKNLIVQSGRDFILARLTDSSIPPQMEFIEVGSGTAEATLSDTGVQVPFTPPAKVTMSVVGGTIEPDGILYTATFPPGVGTGLITEAVILNSANTVLCRTTFPADNKLAGYTYAVSWKISILE